MLPCGTAYATVTACSSQYSYISCKTRPIIIIGGLCKAIIFLHKTIRQELLSISLWLPRFVVPSLSILHFFFLSVRYKHILNHPDSFKTQFYLPNSDTCCSINSVILSLPNNPLLVHYRKSVSYRNCHTTTLNQKKTSSNRKLSSPATFSTHFTSSIYSVITLCQSEYEAQTMSQSYYDWFYGRE